MSGQPVPARIDQPVPDRPDQPVPDRPDQPVPDRPDRPDQPVPGPAGSVAAPSAGVEVPSGPTAPTRGGYLAPRVQAARYQRPGTLVGGLNREWLELCSAPASEVRVRAWASGCPILGDCATLPELEDFLGGAGARETDQILLALLRHGQQGDVLAQRTVLQLMMAKAIRIARSQRGILEGQDAFADSVAALWETIRTYPTERRPVRVAANLALDTLSRVHRRHRRRLAVRTGLVEEQLAVYDDPRAMPAEAEVHRVLAWAVVERVITHQEAQLLVLVYTVGPDGGPARSHEVAAHLGTTAVAVRKRCQRAIHRVAAAVAAGGDPEGPRLRTVGSPATGHRIDAGERVSEEVGGRRGSGADFLPGSTVGIRPRTAGAA